MAVKRPLALYGGDIEELRATDTLPSSGGGGSLTITSAQLDVGTRPILSATVSISDASVVTTSSVFVSIDGSGASGANATADLEWSPVTISGSCQTNGTILFVISGTMGMIVGKFNIKYFIV